MLRFEMTYNEAMIIQRAQMVYYRNQIGRLGIKIIRSRTKCPLDINPNKLMSVSDINALVPRGGSFESLIKVKGRRSCPNHLHWHNAIRRGFF